MNEIRECFQRLIGNVKSAFDYELVETNLGSEVVCRSYAVEGALDANWNNGLHELRSSKLVSVPREVAWVIDETATEIEETSKSATLCRKEIYDQIVKLREAKP